MAVTMAEITKLRQLTSAGLMDCKKALQETNGDIDAAVQILRKKGQAVAAKREDRQAAEGVALADNNGEFAALIALNCETDFVAKTDGFRALARRILDVAMKEKPADLEALKALKLDDLTIAEMIVEESGKTGEKCELSQYASLTAPSTAFYNHALGNKLAVIVGFNQPKVDAAVGKDVAMQIASMNPVAVDRDSVPQSVKDTEYSIAIDKTRAELVKKAVDGALQKAGFNLYISESEEHLNEGIMKGYITEEQAEEIRQIKTRVSAEKAASLPEPMVKNIANGRLNKFFKDSCLMEQEYIMDGKLSVGEMLERSSKGLAAIAFKRVNLNQD